MGKSTISMAIFNSYVSSPEGTSFGSDFLWRDEHPAAVLLSNVRPQSAWFASVPLQPQVNWMVHVPTGHLSRESTFASYIMLCMILLHRWSSWFSVPGLFTRGWWCEDLFVHLHIKTQGPTLPLDVFWEGCWQLSLAEDVIASKMMLHFMSRQCRLHHLGVKRPYKQLDNEPNSFAKENTTQSF